MKKLIPILAMLGALAAIAVLDSLVQQARVTPGSTENLDSMGTRLWIRAAITLAFATVVLALAWVTLVWGERSRLVAAVFLVVGLFLALALTPPLWGYLPTGRFPLSLLLGRPSPLGLVFQAGAFFAVIGLAGFLPRSQRPAQGSR